MDRDTNRDIKKLLSSLATFNKEYDLLPYDEGRGEALEQLVLELLADIHGTSLSKYVTDEPPLWLDFDVH
jgi:hypothetical protein